jgi:NAD(P)-dependent dehydrogenase (short-subunit alcohol dehydrogenase family)
MNNPLDLTGRTVLVTGASSGIGRATAVLLSQLGATVVLNGRDEAHLASTLAELLPGNHLIAPYALDQLEGVPSWMLGLVNRVGRLHGVVHCAGILETVPLRFMTVQQAENIMRVNWLAALELAKGFRQKRVYAGSEGRIVLISSVLANAGRPGMSAYASSKGAIQALARSLAVELAPEGITVNAVAPGLVHTEMKVGLGRQLTEAQIQKFADQHPLGAGSPQDVAYAVAYLLAVTGRWVTGTVLTVDGGFLAL